MSSRKIIPSLALRLADIPSHNARWDSLAAFALTYDPIEIGSYAPEAANIANANPASSLSELRAHLYVEQRRWNHYGVPPSGKELAALQQLVEWMRSKLE